MRGKGNLPTIVCSIHELASVNIPVKLYVEFAAEYGDVVVAKIAHDCTSYLGKLVHEARAV